MSSSWKESFHSPVSLMQGLRSILPFQGGPTIKYEGTSLEVTAAAAAVTATLSGLDEDENAVATTTTFLFSVCLDHRLRIWNVERGDICYTGDILGRTTDPHELGKWTIHPSQTNIIRVLVLEQGTAIVVTYSPVGAGAFKFWKATATPDGRIHIDDLDGAPEPLLPPTPSSADVWTLADFAVTYAGPRKLNLWVLWGNNLVYRVMQIAADPDSLSAAWQDGWQGVYAESGAPTAQTSGPCDPTEAAEKWLDLIFFPGRFSRATLETALAMYERGLGARNETSAAAKSGTASSSLAGGKSLMEAICSVLGSTATLERSASGAMDYDLFRSASEIQWRRFYRLLVELDKQRGEALSLALDPDIGLAWVVCTDCLAVVRECSGLERVYHNASGRSSNTGVGGGFNEAALEKVARLLAAGATLVDCFSDGMLQTCEAALRAELFEDASSKTDEERIQSLSDKAGFWLTDDEYAQVADILGGAEFQAVDETAYNTLFSLFDDVVQQQLQGGRDVRFPFTQFGQKLVIRGIQDTAELFWQIIFRQLVLLVHMEFAVEDERTVLHARLDVGQVFTRLVDALKRLELVRWLSRSEFSVALSRSERESLSGSFSGSMSGSFSGSFSAGGSFSATDDVSQTTQIVTALEGSVGHLLGLGEFAGTVSLSSLLTDIIVDVCSASSTIELDPAMIQCMLLKRGRPDLSLQLSAFASDDPFSTYVQGRTFLALRDFDAASLRFQRAAVWLSTYMRHPMRHSAGLIDDVEWNLFYSGLPNYYAHIVSLFDRPKAYSYVIDFARLSLQFVRTAGSALGNSINGGSASAGSGSNGGGAGSSGGRSLSRSGSIGSGDPAAEVAVLATLRTEMLSRLFTAATTLSRFDIAHSALVSMGQPFLVREGSAGASALQRSGLRHLVERMCESGEVATLLTLPFPAQMRDTVDEALEQKCRAAMEVVRGIPWHYILYSWRVAHNDYRGAASVLLDRLYKLQRAGEGDRFLAAKAAAAAASGGSESDGSDDILDTPVTRQYLMLINTLSCVDPKQAWIYTDALPAPAPTPAAGSMRKSSVNADGTGGAGAVLSSVEGPEEGHPSASQATEDAGVASSSQSAGKKTTGRGVAPSDSSRNNPMASFLKKAAAAQRPPWRKVVTLAALRKEYQEELDRIAAIQNNQFAFGAGGEHEDVSMADL